MNKILAWGAVLLVVLMVLLGASQLSAKAAGDCVLDVRGTVGVTVCDGEVVDSVPLPTVTVTEDVVKTVTDTVTKTVRIPGPTVTVPGPTVTIPGPTVTMGPPAPGTTVFQPGKTATVFVTPSPSMTGRVGPMTAPPETRFAQPTPSRQMGAGRGTMMPQDERGFFRPDIDFGDDEVTAGEVGLGTLTLLALVGLILLALYSGYILGYKDKEEDEADFIRALLDKTAISRGKHS